jgi:hypothetical protein
MLLTIPLSEEEDKLFQLYADNHGLNLADAFKEALFEKIEDYYDVIVAEQCIKEMKETNEIPKTIEEVRNEPGL